MFKRLIGLLLFVAVVLIVVLAVREKHEKQEQPTEPKVEQLELPIIPADSIQPADSLVEQISSEDLIMDMIGIDTVRSGE